MPKGVYAAASAMLQESRSMQAVAENLANAQSPGYRRAEALRQGFASLLAERQARNGDLKGAGGAGVTEAGVHRSLAPAQLQATGSPLDVAISGQPRQFFLVQAPDGDSVLTRNGSFVLDDVGQLVTADGWPVLGQGGPIQLPPGGGAVVIDGQGQVHLSDREGTRFVEQLRVVEIDEEAALLPRSGQYFQAPDAAMWREPAQLDLQQGFLEGANVDPVQELVRMVSLQRRHDAAQRALSKQFSTDGISDVLRGVG